VPGSACFVGGLIPRRQGESRDAGLCDRGGGAYPEAGYYRVFCGSEFVGTGPSRVIVLAHRLRPNGMA